MFATAPTYHVIFPGLLSEHLPNLSGCFEHVIAAIPVVAQRTTVPCQRADHTGNVALE